MLFFMFKFLIIFIYLCIAAYNSPLTDTSKNEFTKIRVRINDGIDINDTIIEVFHNCTCIAYYQCPQIKLKLIEAQTKLQPPECSDTNYLCCEDPSTQLPTTTESETSTATDNTIISSTTEAIISVREINVTCGLPKTSLDVRILNPETDSANTVPGEIPWIVEIFEKRGTSKNYRFKCAGSLIHPKVVLTAQHCVRSNKEDSLKILASGQESFQLLGTPENERNVFKIIKHPNYYSGGLYNDIALLILEEQFEYSNSPLSSICLPRKDQVFDGRRCLGVGWGQNPGLKNIPLKKVDVPVVKFEQCQNLLRETRLGADFELHSSFMCAGGEEGKDTCKGDGGGPLICMDDFLFFQAGIISWGVDVETCGKANQPGVYTNVAQFREWIKQELNVYNIYIK